MLKVGTYAKAVKVGAMQSGESGDICKAVKVGTYAKR